jgi:hypothetical protein
MNYIQRVYDILSESLVVEGSRSEKRAHRRLKAGLKKGDHELTMKGLDAAQGATIRRAAKHIQATRGTDPDTAYRRASRLSPKSQGRLSGKEIGRGTLAAFEKGTYRKKSR